MALESDKTEWLELKAAAPGNGRTVFFRPVARQDAQAAASVLLRCNGADLDEWTGGLWPDDDAEEALKALVGQPK